MPTWLTSFSVKNPKPPAARLNLPSRSVSKNWKESNIKSGERTWTTRIISSTKTPCHKSGLISPPWITPSLINMSVVSREPTDLAKLLVVKMPFQENGAGRLPSSILWISTFVVVLWSEPNGFWQQPIVLQSKSGTFTMTLEQLENHSSSDLQHCSCRRRDLRPGRWSRLDSKVWQSWSANLARGYDLHPSQSQLADFGQWHCHPEIAWRSRPQRRRLLGLPTG